MPTASFLAYNSTYVENLMRHRFVYDVSRRLLQRDPPVLVTVPVAKVDNVGVAIGVSQQILTGRTLELWN
jgi:hypothetical protein